MKYLLDTAICIALIRHQPAGLIQRITSQAPGDVGVSSITLAELAHGAEKSARPEQNISALEQFLLPLALADFDQKAALAYGKIRAQLERDGQTIGSMDLLIAAHAISLETILVTNNLREFHRIALLNVDDWISESRQPQFPDPDRNCRACSALSTRLPRLTNSSKAKSLCRHGPSLACGTG